MTTFLIYFSVVLVAGFVAILWLHGLGILFAAIKKIAPPVPSVQKLRTAVSDAIATDMGNVKSIVDIGSGWGGMTRVVARRFPSASVTGIEILPLPFVYSRIAGMFVKNAKIKFGDAFKYLENKKFDVGITYLLTPEMIQVKKIMSHFKILYVLDFPLPGVNPIRKIKLHKDFLGQHYLYIYKN